jgi:hypothetical protein
MKKYIFVLAVLIGCVSPNSPQSVPNTATDYSGIEAWYIGDSIQWNQGTPSHVSVHFTERDSILNGVMFDSTQWKTFPLCGVKKDENSYYQFWGKYPGVRGTVIDTGMAVFSGANLTITGYTWGSGLVTKIILHE